MSSENFLKKMLESSTPDDADLKSKFDADKTALDWELKKHAMWLKNSNGYVSPLYSSTNYYAQVANVPVPGPYIGQSATQVDLGGDWMSASSGKVTVEHNGEYYVLSPGDHFTVVFDVSLGGQKHEVNQVVKIDSIQPGYATVSPAPAPAPAEPLRRTTTAYEKNGAFTTTFIDKGRGFYLIGGYYNKFRYEVVLGTPFENGETELNIPGLQPGEVVYVPHRLRSTIQDCSMRLRRIQNKQESPLSHPKLFGEMMSCPVGEFEDDDDKCQYHKDGKFKLDLYTMVQHINDAHRWTREAIADWIDTLDEQPVYYPVFQPERVANSARVVEVK